VRDRIQFLAGSVLASHLSDPSAARGQAVGMLGQTLAQWVVAGGHGGMLVTLGAMLVFVAFGVLLFKYGKSHGDQRRRRVVWHTRNDPSGVAGAHAVPLATTIPSRSRPPGVAAMFRLTRPHALLCFAATLVIALIALAAPALSMASPLGTWSTANGHGVIAIVQCGDALCGRIVGIGRKPTEPMPTDANGRPQCGLTIITNERPQTDGTWLGEVTDPRNGGTYHAKLWLDSHGNLRLRGFIGIPALGATQTWHRFTGHLTAACGLA